MLWSILRVVISVVTVSRLVLRIAMVLLTVVIDALRRMAVSFGFWVSVRLLWGRLGIN